MQKRTEVMMVVLGSMILLAMGAMMYVQSVRFSQFSRMIDQVLVQTRKTLPQEVAKTGTSTSTPPVVEGLSPCSPEKQAQIDPLLKAAKLEQIKGNASVICMQSTQEKDKALVATSSCLSEPNAEPVACDTASLLLVDLKTNTIKTLATEGTNEMLGGSVFEAIVDWKSDAVTYNAHGLFPDGECTEAIVKATPAYVQKTVTISRQGVSAVKTCYFSSCADTDHVICR